MEDVLEFLFLFFEEIISYIVFFSSMMIVSLSVTIEILNVFVKEGKKKHQDITEENKIKKSKEIIELKEDKPNNNDDQENENNDEESKDKEKQNNNNCLLNKSKIFEKELRKNKNISSRRSLGRVSLTDTYKKYRNW